MRSLSQKTVLHKLLQRESFPRAAALHELPQRRCLMGCSPSGTGCSSVGPHGVTSPASKPAPVWAPLSTGPQVLPGACSQRGLPTGSQLPSGIHLLRHGVPSMGCRWVSAPPWTSMGCRGTACLTMVFSMGCKGNLFSGILSTFFPFFTDLGVCSCFSHFISLLSNCHFTTAFFFPFLNMLAQRRYHRCCLAWPWPAVGLSQSQLALALSDIGEASRSFSQQPPLQSPPLPKPCHANPHHLAKPKSKVPVANGLVCSELLTPARILLFHLITS